MGDKEKRKRDLIFIAIGLFIAIAVFAVTIYLKTDVFH